MSFRNIKRKKLTVAVSVVAVLAIAGAAFAYFTQAGAGTGTATVGTSSEIALSSPNVQYLYPAGVDVPVTVTIHNPGSGSQYVDTVSGTVATSGGCLGSWFVVDSVVYQNTLTRNGTAGDTDTANTAVRMLNVNSSQNACKDAVLTINWTSN